MLTLEQALDRVLASVPPATPEVVPLAQARDRIAFDTLISQTDLPPFDNSAMDGYAVRAPDISTASQEHPAALFLAGQAAAGCVFPGVLRAGCAVRIFTGAPLPEGADSVVMQEDTTERPGVPGEVLVNSPVHPGENVRGRGEDVSKGAVLVLPGQSLAPVRMALLSAAGLTSVSVGSRPRVAFLATGSELKKSGEILAPGQIYESNTLALAGMAQAVGAIVENRGVVEDDLQLTAAALEGAFGDCDVVVTCGGASVGDTDFVKTAFTRAGGTIDFWRVAMKPGRPFVFGQLQGKLLFGLPGNPVSALVSFLLLARPALLRWQGARDLAPRERRAALAEGLSNPGERRHFMRVRFDESGLVTSSGLQASHALGALASSDGLVDMPPGATLAAGAVVRVITWQ